MPLPSVWNPTLVNDTSGTLDVLGATREYQGKIYKYVRVANGAGDNNLADGDVVCWAATTAGGTTPGEYVSNALAGTANSSGLTNNPPAGVAVTTVTKGNYCYILVSGKHTNVKGVATVTVGYSQKISATAASGTDVAAADVVGFFGKALTALSGGRYTVQVETL